MKHTLGSPDLTQVIGKLFSVPPPLWGEAGVIWAGLAACGTLLSSWWISTSDGPQKKPGICCSCQLGTHGQLIMEKASVQHALSAKHLNMCFTANMWTLPPKQMGLLSHIWLDTFINWKKKKKRVTVWITLQMDRSFLVSSGNHSREVVKSCIFDAVSLSKISEAQCYQNSVCSYARWKDPSRQQEC